MCVCVRACVRVCVWCVCVCVCVCVCLCVSLHCMNETVTLLNLTLFINNLYTWLIVMFRLFVYARYK